MPEKQTNKMGLEINGNKAKYLKTSKNQRRVELNITTNEHNFKIMNNFVYLESMVNTNLSY